MASRCQKRVDASIVTTSKRQGGILPSKCARVSALSHQRAARIRRRCLLTPMLSAAEPNRVLLRVRTSTNTSSAPSRITRSSSPSGHRSCRPSSRQPAACSSSSARSSPASPSFWRGERRGVSLFDSVRAVWPDFASRRARLRTALRCAALAAAKSACVSGSGAAWGVGR